MALSTTTNYSLRKHDAGDLNWDVDMNWNMTEIDKKLKLLFANFLTCSTAAGTAAKVVSFANFVLEAGCLIAVKFTNGNSASGATLNVNSTGAKAIQVNGAAVAVGAIIPNGVYLLVYDGTNWVILNPASVSDAIADGETGLAPTQNAVFDALALKTDSSDVAVTAAANKIPKADALGKIDLGYLPAATLPDIALGDAGKIVIVSSTEDGFEYTSLPEGTLPIIAEGDAGKLLAVNGTEDGYEWIAPDAASDALNAPYEAVEEHGTILVDTTIAASDGNIHTFTVGGNITLTLNPNCLTGFCRTLTLVITNGGAYTITWPASVKWAGGSAPTFTASGVDIVTLITVDAGTTWYGSANGVSYA